MTGRGRICGVMIVVSYVARRWEGRWWGRRGRGKMGVEEDGSFCWGGWDGFLLSLLVVLIGFTEQIWRVLNIPWRGICRKEREWGRSNGAKRGGEMREIFGEEVQIFNGDSPHEDLIAHENNRNGMIMLNDLIAEHIKLKKMKRVMMHCQEGARGGSTRAGSFGSGLMAYGNNRLLQMGGHCWVDLKVFDPKESVAESKRSVVGQGDCEIHPKKKNNGEEYVSKFGLATAHIDDMWWIMDNVGKFDSKI